MYENRVTLYTENKLINTSSWPFFVHKFLMNFVDRYVRLKSK